MDPIVDMLLRAALALLFAAAALHKLRDARGFAAAVAAYRLLPPALPPAAAAALVAAEGAVAGMLLWPPLRAAGSLGAAALLGLYALAMGVNLARGRRDLDCGCLGAAARRPIGAGLVARNLLVAAVALATLAPVRARALGGTDLLTLAAGLLALRALWATLDGLLATAPAVARLRGGA